MQKLLYQAQIEGFYEMFLLDLSTGLRRGELLGLKWDDIDFDEGTLSVKRQVRFEKGILKKSSPKTKASERTIVLPPPIIEMLKEYKTKTNSIWLFPSPVKSEDVPRDPTACRKRLSQILERAGCKHVPFHALRHTFASHAFHYGMDVKTLASTIGHESVETTLNVYAHTSERMKQDAAKQIESTIGTATGEKFALCDEKEKYEDLPENSSKQATRTVFEPYKPKYRRRGTGSLHRISENTWEGRYPPHSERQACRTERLRSYRTRVRAETLRTDTRDESGVRHHGLKIICGKQRNRLSNLLKRVIRKPVFSHCGQICGQEYLVSFANRIKCRNSSR